MILLTVGTQFGFDRLVKAVDRCARDEFVGDEILAQIGPGKYVPKYMRSVETLDRGEFDRVVQSASAIISHAGIGSISLAMKAAKPLLVMPRESIYGEVVNDHQVATARRFAELGCLLVANDAQELPGKLLLLKGFHPVARVPNRKGVIARISHIVDADLAVS